MDVSSRGSLRDVVDRWGRGETATQGGRSWCEAGLTAAECALRLDDGNACQRILIELERSWASMPPDLEARLRALRTWLYLGIRDGGRATSEALAAAGLAAGLDRSEPNAATARAYAGAAAASCLLHATRPARRLGVGGLSGPPRAGALAMLAVEHGARPRCREVRLRDAMATELARGDYRRVLERWELAHRACDPRHTYWPYAASVALEAAVRADDWSAGHRVLDLVEELAPELPDSLRCHFLAVRARLALSEGRLDLAAESSDAALESSVALRAGVSHGWKTVRYAQLRAVELALARERAERVENLVSEFLADEELYRDVPTERAALLLDLAAAREDSAVSGAAPAEAALDALDQASSALRAADDGPERRRLEARVHLARARLALDGGDATAASALLEAVRSWIVSGPQGADVELAMLHTVAGELALARETDPAEMELARADLERSFDARSQRLSELPARWDGRSLLHMREARAPLVTLTRLELALDGRSAAAARGLERVAELQRGGTLARRFPAARLDAAHLRETLAPRDGGLLVYLTEARRSLALVADDSGFDIFELAGHNALQAARLRHLGLLFAVSAGDGAAEEAERVAAEDLAALLFPADLSARVSTWRSVAVAGLDTLGPVAFGCLPLGEHPYLGCALAWTSLPSLPFGVGRSGATAAGREFELDLLLVGEVTPAASLRAEHDWLLPLPLSRENERDLSEPYRSVRVLRGANARPASVLRAIPGARIVQFLVHGVLDRDTSSAGLVLEPEGHESGVLWSHDLLAAGIDTDPPRLVVLASCRTGHGPLRRGDAGSADLGGAWLAAGVPAVVVAHTDLSWGPTIAWSRTFHRHFAASDSRPDEALRRTMAELHDAAPDAPLARFGALEVLGLARTD